MFQDSGLKDKTAIVTGGSRGIGREIVKLLAEEGADVTFFYNKSKEAADAFVAEAKGMGLKVSAVQVDVRDKAAVDAAIEKMERIDILVNNSGVIRDNLLAAMTQDEIKTVLDTNLGGAMNCSQAVVPTMMRQRAGKIINMSSVSGEKGGRGQANYAASKGAINALTKALAVELSARKIQVNAVAPGVIETEMSKDVRDMGGDEVLSKILMKRYGQPREVAHAVCFLASKYADYITGEILHVDGGFKMA